MELVFKVPTIKFDAEDYIDLIDWQSCTVTERPLTMKFTDNDLQNILKENSTLTFEKFPCHTQAVERCVKLVTEASQKVCGELSRDGYIRAKLEARANLPTLDNKCQYFKTQNSSE